MIIKDISYDYHKFPIDDLGMMLNIGLNLVLINIVLSINISDLHVCFTQYLCCAQIQRRGQILDQDLARAQGRAGNHEGPRQATDTASGLKWDWMDLFTREFYGNAI